MATKEGLGRVSINFNSAIHSRLELRARTGSRSTTRAAVAHQWRQIHPGLSGDQSQICYKIAGCTEAVPAIIFGRSSFGGHRSSGHLLPWGCNGPGANSERISHCFTESTCWGSHTATETVDRYARSQTQVDCT